MGAPGNNSPHLGAVPQPSLPERDRPALPALTALGLLSIASYYHDDPEAALQLAADNCNAFWGDAERKRAARAVLEQELAESLDGRDQPSADLEALRRRASP